MKVSMRTLSFILALCGCVSLKAQDIHFSQFYLSPLTLNPALTGVMNCNQRLVANYRSQWASILGANAFQSYSVSYDRKIATGRYDYWGIGGNITADVAGVADFQTFTGKLSGSYSRKMFGNRNTSHYLVVGAEAGVANRSLDFARLQFGTQHDGEGGFDPSLPSQETSFPDGTGSFTFPDVAVGLLWFSVFEGGSNIYGGVAASHLNGPDVSFGQDSVVTLFTRYTGHAGGQLALTPNLGIIPGAVVFSQGPSLLVNFGTSLRFALNSGSFNNSNSFQVGVWARMVNNYLVNDPASSEIGMEAIILSTRFEYENFNLGFSYDLNVSDLSDATNGNGAFEFSLMYLICGSESRGVYCPSF